MRRAVVMIPLILAVLILVLAGLIVLACAGQAVPLDLTIAVGLGWIWYLYRVVPQVTIAWDGVVMGALCLVLFLAGSHAFLGWFRDRVGAKGGRRRARWTLSLGALIVSMFVAGLSAAGIAHQVGWLLTSREPLLDHGGEYLRRSLSFNNLEQIGLGLHNYSVDQETYPPAGTFDAIGRPMHGWQSRILPYIEQQELHDRIDFDVPWDDPRNASAFATEVPAFLFYAWEPTRDAAGYALSHYAGNARLLGGDMARKLSDVIDGVSDTIMAGEAAGDYKPWGYPANWREPDLGINRTPAGFGGPSPGGASFLFADGSVRFLKNSVDPRVFEALCTPHGGEKISADEY